MEEILQDVRGAFPYQDGIIVYGRSVAEHDKCLFEVLQKLQEKGVTLNRKKCVFGVDEIEFLGYRISAEGIRPDPGKVEALKQMSPPTDVAGVRRFLGMAQQMSKFIPNYGEIVVPISELLKKKNDFVWLTEQQEGFEAEKAAMTSETCLAHYDPQLKTRVVADASSFAVGSVISQQQLDGDWKPVAYASRTMSETERHYVQI